MLRLVRVLSKTTMASSHAEADSRASGRKLPVIHDNDDKFVIGVEMESMTKLLPATPRNWRSNSDVSTSEFSSNNARGSTLSIGGGGGGADSLVLPPHAPSLAQIVVDSTAAATTTITPLASPTNGSSLRHKSLFFKQGSIGSCRQWFSTSRGSFALREEEEGDATNDQDQQQERFMDDFTALEYGNVEERSPRAEAIKWMQDMNLTYVAMLNEIIASKTLRNALINELTKHDASHCVRVRFCAAVNEFVSTEDAEAKRTKGVKIIELFVAEKAQFRCEGISAQVQARLEAQAAKSLSSSRANIDEGELARARNHIEQDLCRNADVKQAIVKVFSSALVVVVVSDGSGSAAPLPPSPRAAQCEGEKQQE